MYGSLKKPAGVARSYSLEVDDLPSTAASSVMHSPNSGPDGTPEPVGLEAADLAELGPALASLPSAAAAAVATMDVEHARQLQLKRRIEWYFSAENLCNDQHLRSQMDRFGWVRISDVLKLAGLRQVQATAEDVKAVVTASNLIQASGDLRRIRAKNPAIWAAFAPRPADEAAGALSSISSTRAEFEPEVDIADEELTIAASIEPIAPRASKEGSAWPCVEWLTAEPMVAEPCLDWLLSDDQPGTPIAVVPDQPVEATRTRRHRPRRRGAKHQVPRGAVGGHGPLDTLIAFDSELPCSDDPDDPAAASAPSMGAWLRLSDDAYPSAAGSLLQW